MVVVSIYTYCQCFVRQHLGCIYWQVRKLIWWILSDSFLDIVCVRLIKLRISNAFWQCQTVLWKIFVDISHRKLLNNSIATDAKLYCVWRGNISSKTTLNKPLSCSISIFSINYSFIQNRYLYILTWRCSRFA